MQVLCGLQVLFLLFNCQTPELSREYGLYRQDYCGCVFSKRERERQKAEGKTCG